MSSWRCFPFVESAPRAYRLKASNAAPLISTSAGTFPNPGTHNLTNHSATFSANAGLVGNGTTQYADTGFIPASAGVEYQATSASIGYCDLTGTSPSGQIGVADGSNYTQLGVGGGAMFYAVNDALFTSSYTYGGAAGSWIASRTSGTALTLYLNGASVSTESGTGNTIPNTYSIFILAGNNVGTAGGFSGGTLAYSFAGHGLTGTQTANVRSRFATYMTTVHGSGC